MVATSLGLPPATLATAAFRALFIAPEKVVRVSSYATGEPYFGQSGGNRFDAPGWAHGTPEFATCYFGTSLDVALAESILHDRIAVDGGFEIANTVLAGSFVHRFKGDNLRLLNLTGATLKRLNGHAELTGTGNYAIPQQWSLAVYRNPAEFDGFIYASRHVTLSKALVLFDRARHKLQSKSSTSLIVTPGYAAIARKFGIVGM